MFGNVTPTDPINAWVALVVQAGALGILSYIVIWMVPKMIEEARKERESKDKWMGKMLDTIQTKFEERNTALLKGLDAQTKALIEAFARQFDKIKAALVIAACRAPQGTVVPPSKDPKNLLDSD